MTRKRLEDDLPEWNTEADVRHREMRLMFAEGLTYGEMVPRLATLGLVSCRNCENGTPKTRVTRSKLEVCTTCEDTISQFWRRNLARLKPQEADALEIRWEWEEAHRFIARKCRAHCVTVTTIVTSRTEVSAEGNPVTVVTTRTEERLDKGAMRLLSLVHDKLARFGGQEIDEPDGDERNDPRLMSVREREDPRRKRDAVN